MYRMPGVVAAVLLVGVIMSGCSSADDAGAQPNTTPSTARTTPTEATPADAGRMFTADPTILSAHPIPFTSWSRVAEDRIAVNFQIGSPDCYGVDASATETDSTVTVELRAGTRPDAVGRMCTMIAVFGTLEVPLQAPLGNRQVLNAG